MDAAPTEIEAQTALAATKPLEELELPDTIRPDRNLERWPIWEPANARHAPQARLIQREIHLPDGSKVTAAVEVGFTQRGMLTTEDQKTFYALVKLWEDLGKPTEKVYFSRNRLAQILRRSWGKNVSHTLTESLMRLRFTPFVWERSYYDSTKKETAERIDTFTILSELSLFRRTAAGQTNTEQSWFCFNDRILNNLVMGYTRPVYLDTILQFRSDLAQILYTYLDLVMYDKPRFERRSEALFQDLGIEGSTYRYRSKRLQLLEPAVKELQGAPLPSGYLSDVRMEKTVDGEDYKLVVIKTKAKAPRKKRQPSAPEILPPTVLSRQPSLFDEPVKKAPVARLASAAALTKPETAGAEELVRYFHQTFFKAGETAHPTQKELSQAQDHLNRIGMEAAKHLIFFAYREAKKTRFEIQIYGGIIQYEGRAMAEFQEAEQRRLKAATQKAREAHQKAHQGAYVAYLVETLTQLEKAPQGAFQEFLEGEARTRKALAARAQSGVGVIQKMLDGFDDPSRRLDRFREFLKERAQQGQRVEGVFSFWEWDATLNPETFSAEALSDVR